MGLMQQIDRVTKPVGYVGINKNNPLSKNLIALFYNEQSLRDEITGERYTVNGTGSVAKRSTVAGRGLEFTPNVYLQVGTVNSIGTGDYSITAYGRSPAAYQTYNGVASVGLNGGGSPSLYTRHSVYGSNWALYYGTSSGFNSGDAIPVNTIYSITCVRRNGTMHYYRDGVKLSSTLGDVSNVSTTDFLIGTGQNNNYYGADIIFQVALHDRALTTGEVAGFHKNHWQILKPAIYHIQISASSALIINSLTQSQTIASPLLTQHSAISVNDILQAQTLTDIALIQHNVMSINDITQSQMLGSVTLTVLGTLAIDDVLQGQTLQSLTLTQHGLLTIESIEQSQTIDVLTLSVKNPSLVIASVTQAQMIDAVLLTQHNILVVDDISQTQMLGQVSFPNIVGWLKGSLVIVSALNGVMTITPSLNGVIEIKPG